MNESIAQHDGLDWDKIRHELAEPFDPAEVDFRIQGTPNAQTNKAQVLAYIDARTVQDRLDAVVGIQNWHFDWSSVSTDKNGDVVAAKGTLTIYGISKSDLGDASNFEGNKGAVSGALKRAAVMWGIGRYLYSLPATWEVTENKRVSDATLKKLRDRLPLPKGYTKPTPMPMKTEYATLHVVPDAPPSEQHSEPTEEGWKALKLRMHKSGMCKTKADFDLLMTSTGGSYEETMARAQRWEQEHQHDLHAVPALSGTKGRS